jgi:hypothetical protein
MVTENVIRTIQPSKGEHLQEVPGSMFSTNWKVDNKFQLHPALRDLKFPMRMWT